METKNFDSYQALMNRE